MVTLLGPARMIDTPDGVHPERHLKLGFHDITDPAEDMILPQVEHVERLLAFGQGWRAEAPILVHCWAGVSRSTAAAFILACARDEAADEARIARAMRDASPTAFPNPRMIALADDLLGRWGRMTAAVEAMGPQNLELESQPFDLPVRLLP
jgi:predicted protein tyrosine phosphatase